MSRQPDIDGLARNCRTTGERLCPARVVLAYPVTASAWAAPRMAAARGLPFAVVTDATGAICAVHQGAVQPATIAAFWASCHPAQ